MYYTIYYIIMYSLCRFQFSSVFSLGSKNSQKLIPIIQMEWHSGFLCSKFNPYLSCHKKPPKSRRSFIIVRKLSGVVASHGASPRASCDPVLGRSSSECRMDVGYGVGFPLPWLRLRCFLRWFIGLGKRWMDFFQPEHKKTHSSWEKKNMVSGV